ncbi:MAG: MipA/OmpV family protein [Pseudomonadota bacterium]
MPDSAHADDDSLLLPRWEWGLGIGGAWLSDYPGSEHETPYVLPYPWFVWRSERAELGRGGARGILFRAPRAEIALTLSGNPPSRSDDNPERAGMPDLDAVLEPGLLLRWGTLLDDAGRWRLSLRLPLRMAYRLDEHLRAFPLGGHSEPGLTLNRQVTPQFSWALTAATGIAEPAWHDYYYGVPVSAATADRPAYKAPGGYSGWSVGGRLSWRRGGLAGGVYLSADHVGDAVFAGSPLVATPWGHAVGAHLNWRLGQSGQTIGGHEEI